MGILANQHPHMMLVVKVKNVEDLHILRSNHRQSVTRTKKAMIKLRRANDSIIRRIKSDGELYCNPFRGSLGDVLIAVLFDSGHNIRMLISLLRLSSLLNFVSCL
uniref:Uncharacterized protein n=1 Tax=Curvibacter symbiont subsp. Hydra magnipapillata TaxID=667019 RepID=C9Y941_CURXX|nr:hypothetical protein Csp_A06420 [Curvibacter putative symbiont of Hydra magnipapillata]